MAVPVEPEWQPSRGNREVPMSVAEMSVASARVPVTALPRVQPRRDPQQVRLFVADSHALFRQTLRMVLEMDGAFALTGEASDGREAVAAIERTRPEIALVDLGLPCLNGIEVARRLKRIGVPTRVIILASRSEEPLLLRSLDAGVAGYLLKDADLQELTVAIRKVHAGYSYVSLTLDSWQPDRYIPNRCEPRTAVADDLLTSRERELLQLVSEGHTNKEIANELCVSVKTVEAHKANICGKLNVRGSAALIRHAMHATMMGLGG
jgi:two-component system response regulator NreC